METNQKASGDGLTTALKELIGRTGYQLQQVGPASEPSPRPGLDSGPESGSAWMMRVLTIGSVFQENGQRRYGGPPPGWDGPPPERGSEIFVGKLPRDLFEDELVPLCEKVREAERLVDADALVSFSSPLFLSPVW